MLLTIAPPVILALLAGLLVKFILDKKNYGGLIITLNEYLVGSAVIIFIVAPLVGYVGWEIARKNQVNYNEYLNGWEIAATRNDITCTEDGSCRWTYDCHPYKVYVSQKCNDKKGGQYECGKWETRYHQCPYVKIESTYTVGTTLGSYTISAHRFPDNPQEYRWSRWTIIPEGVIGQAGTGIPKFWGEVQQRIASAAPGPVTARREYKNYILASDNTILKQYSTDIGRYQKQGLLPSVVSSISGFYDANKVSFVGYLPQNSAVWQSTLSRLNAALGAELQGDVQIVIINSPIVNEDPDSYELALKAYWQDMKIFGKNVFSKNGIGIILGTDDGKTVTWARAFTGMPLGNENLVVTLEGALKGKPLEPLAIIGQINMTTVVTKSPNQASLQIRQTSHSGIISSILWGDSDKSQHFSRVSMTGKGSGRGSGYLYLYSEISPTEGQRMWISIITFLLACLSWVGAAAIDLRNTRLYR